ncbi:MAG: hypothetical protein U1G08_17900 [Verrucomicrobiota bacterium]
MNPNDNRTPSASAILRALESRLQAIEWSSQDSIAQPAFERVEIADIADILDVMKRLVISQSRFCVLIYDGANFRTERRGTDLQIFQTHSVVCLVGDRVTGDRVAAFLGHGTTPGAYELARLVCGAAAGNLIKNPGGAFCVPTGAFPIEIQDKTGPVNGRAAMEIDLEITGGEIRSSLGNSPIP